MKRSIVYSMVVASLLSTGLYAGQVVATVNGKNITNDDVSSFLMKINPQLRYENLKPEMRKEAVEQTAVSLLLVEEIKKSDVKKSKEFKDAIAKVEDDLSVKVWEKKEFDKLTVSDDEVKKFYETNKDKMKQPMMMKAHHILVKTEDEAKKIISDILDEKDRLAAFEKSAKANSMDPGSKERGGDLGWFAAGQMVKPFSDAASLLSPKEMTTKPVKSDFGYHVIYLDDKKAERPVTVEEAKGQIVQMIKQEKFAVVMGQKAKALREKAKIELK